MSEHTTALTVDNGCYHLIDPATTQPLLYHTGTGGLVGVLGDGAACVCTGTLTGYVRVTVLPAQEPPPADVTAWEDIVEVTFTSPSGRFRPAAPEAALLPDLASAGPGLYRLRVHTRGRDAGHRAEAVDNLDEIAEEHLIISWPNTDTEAETIIQTKDAFGAHLRTHPSDPATMPPLNAPMAGGGVDISGGEARATGMNLDSTRCIRFD
ncbi:hypothetical protein [Actinomadura rubrisoli]|uniref:Uncharacterized protein n=1 Tax=Actinomadura rubrisoli TaxID=2530368 RepID=A0A4R5BKS4_9ACTN|nr:hypothetical protein [Actinomadura rubrisoli]TDD84412.1 hypothetical protein E1298_19965 [Actinomadura rubrisoli]